MLEHSPLMLHPWTRRTRADGADAWVRPVTDARGASLGFIQFDGDANGSWFSWLKKLRLEVFETDDASHVLTLTRSWGVLGSWEVEDAEMRHVGNLYTKTIVTSESIRLGFLEAAPDAPGRILDLQGRERVTFVKTTPDLLQVTFAPDSSANPFVRMLFLASILTLDPMPRC